MGIRKAMIEWKNGRTNEREKEEESGFGNGVLKSKGFGQASIFISLIRVPIRILG